MHHTNGFVSRRASAFDAAACRYIKDNIVLQALSEALRRRRGKRENCLVHSEVTR